MATTDQKPQDYSFTSGLGKINPAELPEDKLEKYQGILQEGVQALEKRYQQPNWFKVAAGFAKPQLGGFTASLGSAAEALGENVELQRAQQLPIAKMKAEIEQANILMGQRKLQNTIFQEWKQKGVPMDEATATRIISLDPNSEVAQSVKEARTQQNTLMSNRTAQNQMLIQQQQQEMLLLDSQRKSGMITEEQYKAGLAGIAARQIERPPVSPTGTSGTAADRLPGAPNAASSVPPANVPSANVPPVAAPSPTTPVAEAGEKPEFKYKPSFVLPYKQAVTEDEKARNAKVLATAESTNAEPQRQFQALQQVSDPAVYSIALSANDSVQDAIKTDPATFTKVTNLIRQAGGLAAMLEKGLAVNWNGYGINIGIPVSAGIDASLSPDEQAYRDTLINNLATSAYYGLLARGIDPAKAGEGKFEKLLLQEMHIDKNPKAIAHQIDLNKEQLKHAKRIHDIVIDRLPKAIDAGSLSPHFDIYKQDPEIKIENGVYEGILKDKNLKYQKRLKGQRP
jgi:hypothetical protein